jgi:hypothetical protein
MLRNRWWAKNRDYTHLPSLRDLSEMAWLRKPYSLFAQTGFHSKRDYFRAPVTREQSREAQAVSVRTDSSNSCRGWQALNKVTHVQRSERFRL